MSVFALVLIHPFDHGNSGKYQDIIYVYIYICWPELSPRTHSQDLQPQWKANEIVNSHLCLCVCVSPPVPKVDIANHRFDEVHHASGIRFMTSHFKQQGGAGSPQFCCQRRQLWLLREADWDANLCTCNLTLSVSPNVKPYRCS